MMAEDSQLDKDEIDRMTSAALALFLPGLHHPRSMAAGHAERHPLCLAVAKTLSLTASAQLGTHRCRLTLGTNVESFGHVRCPAHLAARLGADPARRPYVSQRIHRTEPTHTHTHTLPYLAFQRQ